MHRGLFRYTVGQRKGLDIKDGKGPYYVIGMDERRNRLIVGGREELYSKALTAVDVNWMNGVPQRGELLTAKVRYRHEGAAAEVFPEEGAVKVEFRSPQKAVTPGQAVVFYKGDTVLGGGWIRSRV
jgi:tRNA-specific 2-thiouridylase